MVVGVLRLSLSIPGARSLKDRRRVVHAFRDRVRARLSASVAEVGDLDNHRVATLGVCAVARDAGHVTELLEGVIRMASGLRDAVLADVRREMIPFGETGEGVRHGIEGLELHVGPESERP